MSLSSIFLVAQVIGGYGAPPEVINIDQKGSDDERIDNTTTIRED